MECLLKKIIKYKKKEWNLCCGCIIHQSSCRHQLSGLVKIVINIICDLKLRIATLANLAGPQSVQPLVPGQLDHHSQEQPCQAQHKCKRRHCYH